MATALFRQPAGLGRQPAVRLFLRRLAIAAAAPSPPAPGAGAGAVQPPPHPHPAPIPITMPAGFRRIDLSPTPSSLLLSSPRVPGDWAASFPGVASARVTEDAEAVLRRPLDSVDIEVKPDGILYMPEIKYRRILCDAFGPGGWGIVPRGDPIVTEKMVTREYALMAQGRFISQAQGENPYFDPDGLPSAIEGCKSNALMRCCKDLGIAAQLWDPVFIRSYRKANVTKLWVVHSVTKKKKAMYVKKGAEDDIPYPYERS